MHVRAPRRAARRLLVAVTLAALAALLAGCGDVSWEPQPTPVAGQGDLTTSDRTTGEFTRISVGVGMKVTVREGAETSVTVEAQENLLPLITTEVVDGQLVVNAAPPGISTTQPMTLTVTAPKIESLALSSGANGYIESMVNSLSLDAAGGASITAIGETADLTLTTSAGAHAELGELKTQNLKVNLSDGSSATVTVTSSVTGTASGGSTLVLTQKPASVSVDTSGGATIQGG